MTKLAPDLFQRRYQDLVELGRARLPSLAPEWTDHNAHDPGITLMELLAWVTEAQLYSLSRMRRDERQAYATLLGIDATGIEPARGLIWPDRADPHSPVRTFGRSIVIPADTDIHMINTDNPTFRPLRSLLWVPGEIEKLQTRNASEVVLDHTSVNLRGGLSFLPFGRRASVIDVLSMTFRCRDDAGLFGINRQATQGAFWPIGVLVPARAGSVAAKSSDSTDWSPLVATLVSDNRRFPVRIAVDTTRGLLTSGVLLLDLDNVPVSPELVTIELRSANGSPFPPRVLRIEPNVIPIIQRRTIDRELHVSNGQPDWSFSLEVPGLSFGVGECPVIVESIDRGQSKLWQRCQRLADAGPDDFVFELDAQSGKVSFGNGLNGRNPRQDSQVFVTYAVSDGLDGQVARNRKWQVSGVAGVFGVNLDAIAGGNDASDTLVDRREARKRLREEHCLIAPDDIVAATKALPLLDVARAWVVPLNTKAPQTGTVTLVAMRRREATSDDEATCETGLWLETVRRRLAPWMPLGTRLEVIAPRYVGFRLRAILQATKGRDPAVVAKQVTDALAKRLAYFEAPGTTPRAPGVSLTRRDLTVWMRAVDGVQHVMQLHLQDANGADIEKVLVPSQGLPVWLSQLSSIAVRRPEPGRSA